MIKLTIDLEYHHLLIVASRILIALDETVELQAFKTRNISQNLRSIITSKIEELKREGKHTNYSISLNDFICWNNVLTNKN